MFNHIKELVALYSKKYNKTYIVSDFDNTISVFDITYQCSVYQIETMAFKVSAEELKDLLYTSIDKNKPITNLVDDIVLAYQHLLSEYGPFTASGLKEDKLESLHNNPYWKEFSAKLKSLFFYVENNYDDKTACTWILYWYTNMTEEEVYNLFKRSCLKYQDVDSFKVTWTSPADIVSKSGIRSCSFIVGCSVPKDVKDMLKYLKDNDIDIWICSSSPVEGVRAAVDAFEISEYITGIIGMTQKLKDGTSIPAYDYEGFAYINKKNGYWEKLSKPVNALPSGKGKVDAIKNILVSQYRSGPLLGLMDASGDFNFCTEFSSMKMVICFNRANYKINDGASLIVMAAMYQKEGGLNLKEVNSNDDTFYLLQGRDENGKRSLRESSYSIQFGKKEEILYAFDENEILYNYLKNNKLSLEEFFNTFSLKTIKENSKIEKAYGFLDSYDGYHNIK